MKAFSSGGTIRYWGGASLSALMIALAVAPIGSAQAADPKTATPKTDVPAVGTPPFTASFTFAIPSKPLAQALDDFGRVTGLSVVYDAKDAGAITAPAISGRFTAEQALQQLLSGSGITHRFLSGKTVTLEKKKAIIGDDAMQLGPVVVSAAGAATALRDAPASISVVGKEEFEKKPIRDLTEVLSKVEGVTLRRAGNLKNVQIRGFDSNYVLSMIDGKRVDTTNSVFRGNDYDTGWVNAEDIERVEVVRGPMSSLYGSDAIGGVVNIITKKPGDKWTGSVTSGYTFQEHRESGDSYKVGFIGSGPIIKDRLALKLTGNVDRRLADHEKVNDIQPDGTRQPGINDNRNANVNAEFLLTPDERNDISLDLGYNRRNHVDNQSIERRSGGLKYAGRWDFGTVEAKAYGDQIHNIDGNIAGQKNPNTSTNLAGDAKVSLPIDWMNQMLTLGGDVRYQKLKDPSTIVGLPGTTAYRATDTETVMQHSLFVEDEIAITDDFRLTFGNRYDHHENFGGHNSPRVYALYHLTDQITARAGWSKAFKAPTLLQNSENWGSVSCGSATVGCYIIGSSDLKPETSISKEFGLSGDFGIFGGGITVFRNDLKNMIDINSRTSSRTLAPSYSNFAGYLPDGRPIFKYQNIAKARTQGVEANLRYDVNKDITVRANYTYLDATNRSSSLTLPLVYRSKHTGNIAMDWTIDDQWSVNAAVAFIGAQYVSVPANGLNMQKQNGFTTMDLGTAYQVNDNVTVRAGVINIADKVVRRRNANEFNEDGRRYYLTATTRF